MKMKTCAEVIQKMREKTEDYPIIVDMKNKGIKLSIILNETKGWDIMAYKDHNFKFVQIAKGIPTEKIAQLRMLINK
jgi:hypothetical protein